MTILRQFCLQKPGLLLYSTGEFHFPNQRAAEIAVETVKAWQAQYPGELEVVFNVFKDSDREIYKSSLAELRSALDQAEAVFVGAGAGLSASAGFAYSGPRFRRYFSDFEEKYGFHDMYTGGFTRFSSPEEQWAYWSRMIFLNRYCDPPKPVYQNLRKLVGDKDYFVLTTNVDHCFQKAGFDKARLFYTQGDYGLWQCSRPCHQKTYDNETAVRQMLEAQGFSIEKRGTGPAPGHVAKDDGSHGTGPPLPKVWRAHEHEPPGRPHLCGGRGLARRRSPVSGFCGEAPGERHPVPGVRGGAEHPRHHQVQFLAAGI